MVKRKTVVTDFLFDYSYNSFSFIPPYTLFVLTNRFINSSTHLKLFCLNINCFCAFHILSAFSSIYGCGGQQ